MPRLDDAPPLTRGVVLRGCGFAIGVALGAIAVWLIVTSTTQKRLELGVLAGLWAAMIGAFSMFGTRRIIHPLESDYGVAAGPGSALELRAANAEVERAEEAAARRAHETRLENMLRREIQTSVGREVSALRGEIAELRGELLEKVGGQLRLERTETTRVIGSNLEALQEEMRRLTFAADTGEFDVRTGRPRTADTPPVRPVVEPARVRPVSRQTADVEADVQPARSRPTGAVRYDTLDVTAYETAAPAPAAPPPAAPPPAAPPPAAPPPAPPVPLVPPAPVAPAAQSAPVAPLPQPPIAPAAPGASGSAPQPPVSPVPPPPASADPPAGTWSPTTSVTVGTHATVPPPVAPAPPAAAAPPTADPRPQPPAAAPAGLGDDFPSLPRLRPFTDFELDAIEAESYTGRRRRIEDPANGKHASAPEEPPRRHRRAAEEDVEGDLLARLLARRGQER